MSNLRTAVVAIGRGENRYATEFVEHYKHLGFTTVIILDNNYDGEEHFEDVLQPYVDDGFVKVLDYRNQVRCQMRGYTETYEKFKNDYDWIAFLDFDEFLVLQQDNDINQFLSRFPRDCQAILTNWLCMTDNDLIHYDPRPLTERFTQPMPLDRRVQYNFPDNCHVKSIIRGGQDIVFAGNPHTTDTPINAYHSNGMQCNNMSWQMIDYSRAHIRHFTTKSCEEFCDKLKRGTPDRTYDTFLQTYVGRYFKINDWNEQKAAYFKQRGLTV